jgi:uncharacterized membrane protein (TIGR02234 family)
VTSPPAGSPSPPPAAGPGRAIGWRSRRNLILLTAAGAGVALLGQGQPWATGRARLVSAATTQVTLDGGAAAPGVSALALVALAGAVALATAGPAVRRVVALLVAGSGVGLVWLVLAARGSAQTLQAALDAATGTTGGAAGSAQAVLAWTPWPLVAAAGGVLVVLAAVLSARWSGSWQGPPPRYERPPATGLPRSLDPDPWDALSRGEDPTSRPG